VADLPVLGFQLLKDDGLDNDDQFKVIFDSGSNPLAMEYLVTKLTPGLTYRFQVKARDVNGLGPAAATGSFIACLVPGELRAPILEEVAKASFAVSWRAAANDGGCPVTSHALHLSDDQDTPNPSYSLHEASIPATTL